MREPTLTMAVRRLSKLAVGALLGLLITIQGAWGAACTSAATGNWSAAATWAAPCNVAGGPVAADTVTIGATHTVTLTAAAAATSVTIAAATAANGIVLGANTLTVSDAVSMTAVSSNGVTSTLNVGTGTLAATSITINGGTGSRVALMTVSTGTITTSGSISFGGTAGNARFTSTGASMVNVGGNFSSGGTLTTTNTGTINFNGSGAQSIGIYTTYNNVTINKSAGTASLLGATSMTGALTVTAGTLAKSAFTLGVAGNLAVDGAVTGTTGAITLSGNGTSIDGTGSITTTTGALTITAAKSILGAANLTIASPISITGAITVTNNGTVTSTATTGITGSVAGSTWTNAANSTLSVSGPLLTTGALTASANSNTVNYAGAAQTVKVPSGAPATYYHLTLGGSGTKTMLATAMTVAGNFTMSGAAGTSATAAAVLTVGGGFTLAASNTFSAGTFSHSVGGDWSNNGTFTPSTGTVTFTGANSMLGGSVATTFNNLTLNKTAGNKVSIVCGTPSPTINATLTLTSGDMVTSGASPACATTCATQVPIIVAAAGAISGGSASSYVQGALRKLFGATGTLNFRATAGQDEFPVGDTSNYTPIEITAGTTSTAGSVTACVTPTDHPQVTTPVATTGINAAKSVNRYWSLTTTTINTSAVPVDATFKFVAGDVDSGATTANFIIEDSNGSAWFPASMPAGGAGATSTRAQSIDLTSTNNDIAIGEPVSGFGLTALPGQFNAFDPPSPGNSLVIGMIQTKQAGVAFGVRIIRLNAAKNAIDTAYAQTGVTVELLDSSDNSGALSATTGCRPIGAAAGQWHPIAGTSQTVNVAAGVVTATVSAAMLSNVYKDVRVHVVYSGFPFPNRGEGCSIDRFAIRPQSLTASALDATSATAGTTRALNNTGATGGNMHKAATAASPLPFTLRVTPVPATATNYDGNPSTVAGFPTCGTLCTMVGGLSFTAGSWTTPAGNGVRENATANYSDAGTFNLQLEDATYASVDVVDGSSAATYTVPATGSVEIGRFIPHHFSISSPTLTAACTATSAPFTYFGQDGFTTAFTLKAQNAANGTTKNYTSTLAKLVLTSDSSYGFSALTLPTGSILASSATAPSGTWSDGVSSVSAKHQISRPTALTAQTTATISAAPTDGEVPASSPTGLGSATLRYGRLQLNNAYGSELLPLPVSLTAQYWNGNSFIINADDSCTAMAAPTSVAGLSFPSVTGNNLSAGETTASVNSPFVAGNGGLSLTKPGAGNSGYVVITVTAPIWLQFNWTGAGNANPTSRATFGIFKSPLIYRRENY